MMTRRFAPAYGDPEAGRAWSADFTAHLKSLGARVTDHDPNLGRIDHELGYIIYARYVDEVIGAGSTPAVIEWFRASIDARYAGCTHGPWRTVLGFGVTRDLESRTVSVNATKLITDVAKRRGVDAPAPPEG